MTDTIGRLEMWWRVRRTDRRTDRRTVRRRDRRTVRRTVRRTDRRTVRRRDRRTDRRTVRRTDRRTVRRTDRRTDPSPYTAAVFVSQVAKDRQPPRHSHRGGGGELVNGATESGWQMSSLEVYWPASKPDWWRSRRLFWWRFAVSLMKTEQSCMLQGDEEVDIGQVVLVGGWEMRSISLFQSVKYSG